MKTVICQTSCIAGIADPSGKKLPKAVVEAPKKGKEYRVTGEYRSNGFLYYFLMGFGIKTVFKSDMFQDA